MKLVVGNWKLNGSRRFIAEFLPKLLAALPPKPMQQPLVLCPPAIFLADMQIWLQRLSKEFPWAANIQLGAQDVSQFVAGAFTGEISAEQLVDLGCRFVIIGHSERRQYQQENNVVMAKKIQCALKAGLTPMICVGETEQQRAEQQTFAVLAQQLAVLNEIDLAACKSLLLAYEPVWAIGTGKAATVAQAVEVHDWITGWLQQTFLDSAGFAQKPPVKLFSILYGGSVKPDNAAHLFQQNTIGGGLVGGCALDPLALAQIYRAADNPI